MELNQAPSVYQPNTSLLGRTGSYSYTLTVLYSYILLFYYVVAVPLFALIWLHGKQKKERKVRRSLETVWNFIIRNMYEPCL